MLKSMSPEEQRATIERLKAEHKDLVLQRLLVVERTKQIADALKRLAAAIDSRPDFEAVSQDSILHQYLDLSKIAHLVIEEQQLSEQIEDRAKRLGALGFGTHA